MLSVLTRSTDQARCIQTNKIINNKKHFFKSQTYLWTWVVKADCKPMGRKKTKISVKVVFILAIKYNLNMFVLSLFVFFARF